METESVEALPRYLVAFLHHMGPYNDYLKWNIAEASHKITVTLTWNFHCPLASNRRRGPATKTAGLWSKLQRTLRLPRAADTVQPHQEGSVPREVTDFLRRTSDDRAACLRQGNHVAVRPRGWSDTLRDLRQKRRLRSSLSLPEKITGGGASGALFTPADEYRSTTLRKDYKAATTSYPSTPTRSQWSVQGNGRPPETLSSGKTISWPRFGDLWFVADSVGAIGVEAASRATEPGRNNDRRERWSCTWSCHDDNLSEGTYRSRDDGGPMCVQQQQPAIFIQRASPETPSTDDEQGQDEVTETALRSNEVGGGRETGGSQPSNNHTVNQTVLKCLDSCDKILFRHSTTIT